MIAVLLGLINHEPQTVLCKVQGGVMGLSVFCWVHIFYVCFAVLLVYTRVGTLIVATIYLQLIQNRYMSQSFTVLQCSHQHCVQPVASDVEVVGTINTMGAAKGILRLPHRWQRVIHNAGDYTEGQ